MHIACATSIYSILRNAHFSTYPQLHVSTGTFFTSPQLQLFCCLRYQRNKPGFPGYFPLRHRKTPLKGNNFMSYISISIYIPQRHDIDTDHSLSGHYVSMTKRRDITQIQITRFLLVTRSLCLHDKNEEASPNYVQLYYNYISQIKTGRHVPRT